MVLENVERAYWAVVVGTGGLATAIIENLVNMDFSVIVCCRSALKADRIGRDISERQQETPSSGRGPRPVNIHHVECDLADFASIRLAAENIKRKNVMLKLLINAAGIYSPEDGLKSLNGLDLGYAVNFIGPVLIMQLLHPLLRSNSPSTVINVAGENYASSKKIDIRYVDRQLNSTKTAGRLRVLVQNCRELPSTSGQGMANSYVRLSLFGQTRNTDVKRATVHPEFNQTLEFLVRGAKNVHEEILIAEIWSVGMSKEIGDTVMGACRIPLAGLVGQIDSLDSRLHGTFQFVLTSSDYKGTDQRNALTRHTDDLKNAIVSGDTKNPKFKDLHILDVSDKHMNDLGTFNVRSLRIAPSPLVSVDEEKNQIIFIVSKRLNFFKTSKRHIVLDFKKRVLRNETIHGRMRKQFPFDQIYVIEAEQPNDPAKAIVKFLPTNLVRNGVVVAVGGQRDYSLTFVSIEMKNSFVQAIDPFLPANVRYDHGKIEFKVVKKLNSLQSAERQLVLDVSAKKMYNIDENSMAPKKNSRLNQKQLNQKAAKDELGNVIEDHDLRKVFNFADISNLTESKAHKNELAINFRGGQRPYEVSFLTTKQKITFVKVIQPFLYTPPTNAKIQLRIDYTRAASKLNEWEHLVGVRASVPTTDGKTAAWVGEDIIHLPPPPPWHNQQWDTSTGMTSVSLQGVRRRDQSPTECCSHAKLCLVAYTMEAARRSAAYSSHKGVQFHVLDPGLMKTRHYNHAVGLGQSRKWLHWKAQWFGVDPRHVAGAVDFMVRNKCFEDVNGLYVKFTKGSPVILNLSKDEKFKLPPRDVLDPYSMKLHGITPDDSAPRVHHPIAGTLDHILVKRLWESHVNMTGYDVEDPIHSFFLNMNN